MNLPHEIIVSQTPNSEYQIDMESVKNFFPDKPNSKRVNVMRTHAKTLSASQNLIKVSIELPNSMLIEQINLLVDQTNYKKQSEFSKNFLLISTKGNKNEIALKSAYSECITRTGKIEYNVVGVTQILNLIFAKEKTAELLFTDQIQMQIQQAADIDLEDRVLAGNANYGITTDEDDDYRILDSLPMNRPEQSKKSDLLLNRLLKSIEIVGFNMTAVPAITNLTYFMNQSLYLESRAHEQEAYQVDLMTCQLLVTTKRATQAIEMYRKMQMRILSQTVGQHQKYKQFVQCAVYELLIADSLSPALQLKDKINSIGRLACFLRAEEPSDIRVRFPKQVLESRTDPYSSMLTILPDCLRFTLACLSHKMEIVRISALKMIKYILETIGCSLDQGMIFILKAMFKMYPGESGTCTHSGDDDFDLKRLLDREISITEYLFKQKKSQATQSVNEATKWQSIDEPVSGSKRALINIYNSVLDTFVSVLSSVSSHILHGIFYNILEKSLLLDAGFPLEVRVFTCKIADKIFTICQGDLILSPQLLDSLLSLTSNLKAQLPDSIESTAQSHIKSLWQSIRQKVLPNYSQKGFQILVNWLVQRLTEIKGIDGQDDRVRQLAEVITIVALGRQKSEEEANQLIRLPSNERYGGGASSEFYLVLSPLLYWLEYSIDREERLPLFVQLYQTVKDVLVGLPKGQSDLDIVSIIFPSLQRASDFMANNSPNLSMLKFLELVLTDMCLYYQKKQRSQPPLEIQLFFHELLANFVPYISYSMYEESLFVFEKLIALCSDVINEQVVRACIVALIDKYTPKSKQFKSTISAFMKFILNPNPQHKNQFSPNSTRTEALEDMLSEGGFDQSMTSRSASYFEVMTDFCFFSNSIYERQRNKKSTDFCQGIKQLEFRSKQDIHDLDVEKLQFFIDCLSMMNEQHITVFTNLITHPSFKLKVMSLIESGELIVRVKAHEIMETLVQYFVQFCPSKTVYEFTNGGTREMMDSEFISHERLYISQIVVSIAKFSLQKSNDCYLQFNALILLDFLFQNLLPVPSFQNELLKTKRKRSGSPQKANDSQDAGYEKDSACEVTIDVEILSISESTPELDVMDPAYLKMRMKLVISLWPYIQEALNSPWSNIRSICYGLICSMIKIDVNDYPKEEHDHKSYYTGDNTDQIQVNQSRLAQIVLPMLYTLLSSKESESKAGGLNILGSFCGLAYDFSQIRIHKHFGFLQRNSKFISYSIWRLVFGLQDDWDITIKEASVVLIQLCAPRNAIMYFQSQKDQREHKKLDYILKMEKVSDAYARKGSIQEHLPNDCPVRSEYAKRAITLFPTANDCQAVLEQQVSDSEEVKQVTFQDFMFSKQLRFSTEILSCVQILKANDELAKLINEFNPTYEDKRLTQPSQNNQQPMSRRRQIEIELCLNTKGKDVTGQASDTNFFIDGYTDDQIQEIVSIFRNDFKPPKSLWIEKQPNLSLHNMGGSNQPLRSQSPDYFQDIYSEAIDQFNQHQIMMQQKQQDELQQQVQNGNSLSQSSVSSNESLIVDLMVNNTSQMFNEKNDSQNSSTPSPNSMAKIEENNNTTPTKLSLIIQQPTLAATWRVPDMPGTWPTSPVLVSQSDKNKSTQQYQNKRKSLQLEQVNCEDLKVTPIQSKLDENESIENNQLSKQVYQDDFEAESSNQKQDDDQLKNENQKVQYLHQMSSSQPDFSLINIKNSPKNHNTNENNNSSSGTRLPQENRPSNDHKISRKTAQTYLSNLNQGYLQNINNLKLVSTCLSQQNMNQSNQPNSLLNIQLNMVNQPQKKISIKVNPNQNNENQPIQNVAIKNYKVKKPNLSNSPENTGTRKSSKHAQKKHKLLQTKPNNNNLADLNLFIKTIEKDLTEKFKSMKDATSSNTPSSIMKKVEDQMRALGVDPKVWKQVEQHHIISGKQVPPQMKLLALNQIVKNEEMNLTPSSLSFKNNRLNHKTSSPKRLNGGRSQDSDSDFCKTQRFDKKKDLLQNSVQVIAQDKDKMRTYRESESREKDGQSSERREVGSNNSAGQFNNYHILTQPAILTERSFHNNGQLNIKNQVLGKQSNSTRYDSAGLFQFKKGSSKSQQKGYSALARKSMFSPTLKRDQQSGSLLQGKLNMSANQIQTSKLEGKSLSLKKPKTSVNVKAIHIFQDSVGDVRTAASSHRQPQSTRNNIDQGERKQFSPESAASGTKLQLKKKKAVHSHNNSSSVAKPTLVLQQPSYF